MFALRFARRGYVVFNVNYRLAREARFPAAIEDVCAAHRWIVENAHRFGGDVGRLVYAGESAGANLVTSLAIATSYERPEAFARSVWDTGVQPQAVAASCGLYQVTDPVRYVRHRSGRPLIYRKLIEASTAYLGPEDGPILDLADPLLVFERGTLPSRPLPAFFVSAGTRDWILRDTQRLERAFRRLELPGEFRYYPGQPHGFHGSRLFRETRKLWRQKFDFLERHV